ncbi:MAG: M48 family metallopeptidase [Alteromonadaceae bacterium]|nr:M48 family metallopeptidase [Alteromonadaceae bacterium]
MPTYSNGTLYFAGSAGYQQVQVTLSGNGLVVLSDDGVTQYARANRDEISVASKVANLPREVVLPNKDLLNIEADENLNHWLDTPAGSKQSIETVAVKLESSRVWLIASILLSPLLLFGTFKYLVPALAITFADYVPDSLTAVTSRHTLAVLDRTLLSPSTLPDETASKIRASFSPLLAAYSRDGRRYRVLFRQTDAMGANAFALPDGTIVFTDDIIELMGTEPGDLQAILLHEIGHVEHNHSMRLVAESLATTLIITYFFGDVSGLIELFMGVSGTVVENQYSQRLEWEADGFALEQGAKFNLEPKAFVSAMSKLADALPPDSQSEHFFSSHPLLQERINRAREAQQNQH